MELQAGLIFTTSWFRYFLFQGCRCVMLLLSILLPSLSIYQYCRIVINMCNMMQIMYLHQIVVRIVFVQGLKHILYFAYLLNLLLIANSLSFAD